MKTFYSSTTRRRLLFLVTLLMSSSLFATKSAVANFAQTKDKNEKEFKKLTFKNDPIEIVSLKNSSRPIKFGEKFIQERDWLKDFTVEVKNISDKPILSATLRLNFPETKLPGDYMMVYTGLLYGTSLKPKPGDGEPFRPGQSINVDASKFAGIKRFIEKRFPLDDLSQVVVYVDWVVFEDGTAWSMGDFERPDPNNPGKLIIDNSKKINTN